jgi:hypothetical protein
MKSTPKWKDRDILDEADKDDLETRAAIKEFHDRMPRHEAEEKAHDDYKKDKIYQAAGHHLKGVKAAHAIGDIDTAKKHGVLYKLALNELGHKDHLDPPKEVLNYSDNAKDELHKFKSHIGDYYVLPKEEEKKE